MGYFFLTTSMLCKQLKCGVRVFWGWTDDDDNDDDDDDACMHTYMHAYMYAGNDDDDNDSVDESNIIM